MALLSTVSSPGRFLPGRGAPARTDLRWVAVATLLAYLLASTFELSEWLASRTAPFEVWQLDELPLTVAVLSLGLAWYGWRRWKDCARLLSDNRELARQLIAVQEGERIALARELHDELAQDCTAIRIEATYLRRSQDADAIRAAAERAAEAASRLLDGLRGVLRKLRPAELDELGLAPALLCLVGMHEKRFGARCDLVVEGSVDDLGPMVDITVYRVAQEALSNVARHAQARHVSVMLTRSAEMLFLRIRDDGCGFDPTLPTRGVGRLGMDERAAALGARVVTSSAPGAGTALCLTVPLLPDAVRTQEGA